jgi:hypothetical protein
MVVIEKVIKKDFLITTDIIDAVSNSISIHRNDIVKENITRFCDSVLPVVKKIPVKNYWEKNFLSGMGDQKMSHLTSFNQDYNANKELNFLKNSHFNDGVSRFIDHLDETADKLLDSVNLLIEFSRVNEVLTFLCSNQLLAQGLGLKLFLLLCLGHSTSFTFFLLKVQVHLEKLITPFYHYTKVKFNFLCKHKYVIGGTFSGLGFLAFQVKNLYSAQIKYISIPSESSWAPKAGDIKNFFQVAKNVVCIPVYIGANIFVSFSKAIREGLFDGAFTHETRAEFEKVLNILFQKYLKK